jgi:hypothetical protein
LSAISHLQTVILPQNKNPIRRAGKLDDVISHTVSLDKGRRQNSHYLYQNATKFDY